MTLIVVKPDERAGVLEKYLKKHYALSNRTVSRFVLFGVQNNAIFRGGYFDTGYAEEWARRFQRGEEYIYADSDNLAILKEMDDDYGIQPTKKSHMGVTYRLFDIYYSDRAAEKAVESVKEQGGDAFVYRHNPGKTFVGSKFAVYAKKASERKIVKKSRKGCM